MVWDDYHLQAVKLCVWREARGEGHDGCRAVAHVIFNRAKNSGHSLATVVYFPLQFSSMSAPRDPQLDNYPKTGDVQMQDIEETVELIASGGDADLTNGATHYFNPNVVIPDWAKEMTLTLKLGNHDFYK